MRRPLAIAAAGALTLALAGCGGASDDASTPVHSTPSTSASTSASGSASIPSSSSSGGDVGGISYVALGDSYSAAPGLPPEDTSAGLCSRSLANYPHLLAKQHPDLTLSDQTCSGATSQDVIDKQSPALSADTDLVTVSIGGNDGGLFVTVLGGCAQVASSDPTGSPCTQLGEQRADEAFAMIRTNLEQVLTTIDTDAPDATVVVVGYPQILPGDGTTCPDLVPIAAGDYPFVTSVNQRLSAALKQAAAAHDADYVDVYSASRGHDVCSKDPWVNGQSTAPDGVIPFHPFGNEQRAVAKLVAADLPS